MKTRLETSKQIGLSKQYNTGKDVEEQRGATNHLLSIFVRLKLQPTDENFISLGY